MADINQLHPTLKHAYTEAKAEFMRDFPGLPRPILVFTHRSNAVQNALFMQGRASLEVINAARKPLGLYKLSAAEAARKVTNARGGQSPHNYLPALAFDVAFTRDEGATVLWTESLYPKFAPYVLKHAGIEWGGAWTTFRDLPHFQVKNWKAYAHI